MANVRRKQTTVYNIELLPEEYKIILIMLQTINGVDKKEQAAIDDLAETFREAWIDD